MKRILRGAATSIGVAGRAFCRADRYLRRSRRALANYTMTQGAGTTFGSVIRRRIPLRSVYMICESNDAGTVRGGLGGGCGQGRRARRLPRQLVQASVTFCRPAPPRLQIKQPRLRQSMLPAPVYWLAHCQTTQNARCHRCNHKIAKRFERQYLCKSGLSISCWRNAAYCFSNRHYGPRQRLHLPVPLD